ncbi:MAG TPA: YdcF family protein [Burkholderiales bacterium]|nr:YdcF family protein [Burkholderiales bacterium]
MTNAIVSLLLPPGIVLLILLLALILAWRRPLAAWKPVLLGFLLLYVLSMPFMGRTLLHVLEPAFVNPVADPSGQAIVVLGGGTYFSAPEYGGDTVKPRILERLRYAAHLNRALQKPILVTGGAPEGNAIPEARLMRDVMQRDFQVPVQWTEETSNNTLENARASFLILNAAGVRRIYLVTHAWHMPRAKLAFTSMGFTVVPAATGYATRFSLTALDFLPSANALVDSSRFFHEAFGLAWYYARILVGV